MSFLRLPALLALVAFQPAMPSSAQTLPSRAAAQGMTPRQLGQFLLGAQRGSRVASVNIGTWPHRAVTSVVLSEEPEQIGEEFCARRDHHVRLVHVDPSQARFFNIDAPTRVDDVMSRRSFALRLGGDCAERATYSVSNNMTDEQVMAVLRRLVDARAQAERDGPLPFSLTCSDDPAFGNSVCDNGGRAALASLPLDQISSINPVYNSSCVRVVFEYPGDVCPPGVAQAGRRVDFWEIQFAMAAGRGLTWIVGLAGETTTTAIEVQRDHVVYH